MSGLYNAVFGHHRTAPLVLFSLQKSPQYFGRFRDAWVERLPDSTLRFAVYTRNGGGNRLHAGDDPPKGPDCTCSGCVMEYVLPNDPQYLSDQDDDYDSTYATVYFSIPANAKERLIAAGAPPDMQFETVAEPHNRKIAIRFGAVAGVLWLLGALFPNTESVLRAYALIEGSKVINAENAEAAAEAVGKRFDRFLDIVDKSVSGRKETPPVPKDANGTPPSSK